MRRLSLKAKVGSLMSVTKENLIHLSIRTADGKGEDYSRQVQEALKLLADYRDTMKDEGHQRSSLVLQLRKELAEQEAQQKQLDLLRGNIEALEAQFLASKAILLQKE